MTALELFEKHGAGIWWAHNEFPGERHFKPLAINEQGTHIIVEFPGWGGGGSVSIGAQCYQIYQPPKQKVVRWKWAFRSDTNPTWMETNCFLTEEDVARSTNDGFIYKKLEFTRTEFSE